MSGRSFLLRLIMGHSRIEASERSEAKYVEAQKTADRAIGGASRAKLNELVARIEDRARALASEPPIAMEPLPPRRLLDSVTDEQEVEPHGG